MRSVDLPPVHQRIYERWHQMINARDLGGLMELYAEDSTVDSAAVLVLEKDPSGVLHGKDKICAHFQAFFALLGTGQRNEWYRSPSVMSDGGSLLWEYPSAAPLGEQLDVVESFDIHQGLISYHRVYWGRVGFKMLSDALASKSPPISTTY